MTTLDTTIPPLTETALVTALLARISDLEAARRPAAACDGQDHGVGPCPYFARYLAAGKAELTHAEWHHLRRWLAELYEHTRAHQDASDMLERTILGYERRLRID